jgi:hypothetical protein
MDGRAPSAAEWQSDFSICGLLDGLSDWPSAEEICERLGYDVGCLGGPQRRVVMCVARLKLRDRALERTLGPRQALASRVARRRLAWIAWRARGRDGSARVSVDRGTCASLRRASRVTRPRERRSSSSVVDERYPGDSEPPAALGWSWANVTSWRRFLAAVLDHKVEEIVEVERLQGRAA